MEYYFAIFLRKRETDLLNACFCATKPELGIRADRAQNRMREKNENQSRKLNLDRPNRLIALTLSTTDIRNGELISCRRMIIPMAIPSSNYICEKLVTGDMLCSAVTRQFYHNSIYCSSNESNRSQVNSPKETAASKSILLDLDALKTVFTDWASSKYWKQFLELSASVHFLYFSF